LSVTVNGEALVARALTLADLIAELGYGDRKIATAVNGTFVAHRARAQMRLAAGDQIEIVSPRQGG
jgi:sulfur carrier protein